MSEAPTKKRDFLDPIREAQAVAALRASISELDSDDELLADTIEGETRLFEIVDKILDRMREAQIMIAGIEAVEAALATRRTRQNEAVKRDRTLLEQAMMIAGVEKITRPTGTLSLSFRAPSLQVTEESDIPACWWKSGAPVLDKKGLTEALRERAAVLADPEMTPEAKTAALAGLPEIKGAELSNGAPSLSIRTK